MRKRKKPPVVLDEYNAGRVAKTLTGLNKLVDNEPYATVHGRLSLLDDNTGQQYVGEVYYHAPVESYVIEWTN